AAAAPPGDRTRSPVLGDPVAEASRHSEERAAHPDDRPSQGRHCPCVAAAWQRQDHDQQPRRRRLLPEPHASSVARRAVARERGGDRFVVGRDTRVCGPLLEAALAAGLSSEGVRVETIGVVPTPVVAWTAATEDVAGAMISASHNLYPDNGIKLFARGGRK